MKRISALSALAFSLTVGLALPSAALVAQEPADEPNPPQRRRPWDGPTDVPPPGHAMQRDGEATLPAGHPVQHQVTRTRGGDTLTFERTLTGPQGQMHSLNSTITRTPEMNSIHHERDITLRDGRTVHHDMTRTRDGDTVTLERNFTGPNGQTRTFEHTITRPDNPAADRPAKPEGLLGRLNPFRRAGNPHSAAARSGGFTLGSSRQGTPIATSRQMRAGGAWSHGNPPPTVDDQQRGNGPKLARALKARRNGALHSPKK
jgi:hypothetical protein